MEDNMGRKVEFPLEDGSTIVVQVDEPETGGTIRASRFGDVVEVSKYTFDEALRRIYAATERAIIPLRELSIRPKEIEMEFGINLSGEFGAFIAKSSGNANYKVTLRWSAEE